MGDVRITNIVDNYESAKNISDGIFEDMVLEGVRYKSFVHDGELYIPTVVYELVYRERDAHLAGIERHIAYQKISKELIKAVIECN